jgi:hypothetical protein
LLTPLPQGKNMTRTIHSIDDFDSSNLTKKLTRKLHSIGTIERTNYVLFSMLYNVSFSLFRHNLRTSKTGNFTKNWSTIKQSSTLSTTIDGIQKR